MLVHVRDADGARRAEEGGAKGIVVRSGEMDLRVHTHLPLLAYGPAPEEAADTDAVVLTVADTGVGFSSSSGSGLGLANVSARLAAQFGDTASLVLGNNDLGGATATIALPLTHAAVLR